MTHKKLKVIMKDCIFCKIINKEIVAEIVFENAEFMAFNDISPQANHHILIIPKKHIPTINDLNETEGDERLVGGMVLVARNLAKGRNLAGYNLQFNVGESGGQTVFHIHLHLLSSS